MVRAGRLRALPIGVFADSVQEDHRMSGVLCRERSKGFTIIELLVVITVIAILAAMLMPVFGQSKHVAWEAVCKNNLHQVYFALRLYANSHDAYFPVEAHEHNPHKTLLDLLEPFSQKGLIKAMYCPQAPFLEMAAKNKDCPPKGETDSVVDTTENHEAGNISYVYWSFFKNKPGWRGMPFFPRVLKTDGYAEDSSVEYQSGSDSKKPFLTQPEYVARAKGTPASRIWLMTDFFRRGSPVFPHVRKHAGGLNVLYVDGHVGLVIGRPRDNYR